MQFGTAGEECELREKEGALGHGGQTSQAMEEELRAWRVTPPRSGDRAVLGLLHNHSNTATAPAWTCSASSPTLSARQVSGASKASRKQW